MTRNRILSATAVALWLAALHGLVPDRAERLRWLNLTALPLAYGHVLGAFIYSWPRFKTRGALEAAFACVTALTLFSTYLWLMHTELRGIVLAPLVLVAAWHIVENDLALARAYRSGGRPGAPAREARDAVRATGAGALLVALGLLTGEGGFYLERWLGLAAPALLPIEDLTTAVLMYHTFSWIVFFADRGRCDAKFVGLHAVPFVVAAAGLLLPPLTVWVTSPAFYVFWSVAHAFQTAAVRRPSPAAAR